MSNARNDLFNKQIDNRMEDVSAYAMGTFFTGGNNPAWIITLYLVDRTNGTIEAKSEPLSTFQAAFDSAYCNAQNIRRAKAV
ncbi:MAG: hypothetical protein IT366_24485 [Candidatus Hydrogenedentes bacterium]|nr:hypothetical protein [Candidatus Hydrogenedentota bacterium]